MAKKTAAPTAGAATAPAPANGASKASQNGEVLRQPAEVKYADELAFLASVDKSPRPFTWKLSPRMVPHLHPGLAARR